MAHHDFDSRPRTAADSVRQLKALRLMIVILIPIAIWTVVGLVAFWPSNVSRHVQADLSQYSVSGLTVPTGEITKVTPTSCSGQAGSSGGQNGTQGVCADITVQLLDGPEKNQQVQVSLSEAVYSSGAHVGQKVKLFRVPTDGAPAYQFSDFDRSIPLLAVAIAFAVAVIAVARWRGLASLLGLGFAGFILLKFLFPALIIGSNPIAIGLIASSAIMFVVIYAAHGFNARSTTALLGTLFGLVVTAGLGWGTTVWAHLTGVSSDDDFLLSATAPDLRLTSVVICGVIVAGLGVLNDVTITQASAVWELADATTDHSKLFSRAMRIGRDHIASTVYTIAFATAGASLGALLLIAIYDRPLFEVLQTEAFAGEIIRTLVGSIGLVLAVPLTTAIGVAVVRVGDRGAAKQLGTEALTASEAGALNTPTWDDQESAEPISSGDPADHVGETETEATADREPEPTPKEPKPRMPSWRVTKTEPDVVESVAVRDRGEDKDRGRPGKAAEDSGRRSRLRRRPREDDFGDFSDLRDSDDDDPPRPR